jgi:hypothetical protein
MPRDVRSVHTRMRAAGAAAAAAAAEAAPEGAASVG